MMQTATITIIGTVLLDLASTAFYLLTNNKTVGFASGLIACVLLWRTNGRFKGGRVLVIGAAIFFILRAALVLYAYEPWDLKVYHDTGRAILSGADPYQAVDTQYPVNALPFFALVASVPLNVAAVLWYAFNTLALFATLRLGQILANGHGPTAERSRWDDDAPVTVGIMLAGATTWGIDAGQLVVWTALWVYVAVRSLLRNQQVAAGLAMIASSLKITTALPFAILLLDRRHWKSVAIAAVGVLVLCFCLYPPKRVIELQQEHIANVNHARDSGEINDYTFNGPYHDDMLGLEHWLYCLGLRDQKMIGRIQLVILGMIGAGILWDFRLSRRPRDETLLVVLLCVYACVFLYHRIYDAVILALPCYYAMRLARQSSRGKRILLKAIVTGFLLVLNFPRGGVAMSLARWTESAGVAGRIVQAVVLPYGTWILLIALGLLWALGRQRVGGSEQTGIEHEAAAVA